MFFRHGEARDQEMIALEKIFCHLKFLKGRGMPHPAVTSKEAPGLVRSQKE